MKTYYDSEKSLKLAIEKEIHGKLKPEVWEKCKPSYSPPYDVYDLNEIINLITEKDVEKESQTFINPIYVQTKITLNEFSHIFEKDRERFFGTKTPPFNNFSQAKEWLKKQNKNLKQKEFIWYWYIRSPFKQESVRLVIYDNSTIYHLYTITNLRSKFFNLDQSQIVSFLLFGKIRPDKYKISHVGWEINYAKSINSFGQIKIFIYYPISISELTDIYRKLRLKVWQTKKNIQPMSEKEGELAEFILREIGWKITNFWNIDWNTLFLKWNNENSQWRFDYIEHFRISVKRTLIKIYPSMPQ